MNWFLTLIILVLVGGGYYEYQNLEGQITDLKAKADTAEAGRKTADDSSAQLSTQLKQAQTSVGDLTTQLQTLQADLAKTKAALTAANTAADAIASTGSTTLSGGANPNGSTAGHWAWPATQLGTIATVDGKNYQACRLLKVEVDGIVVNHADGITKILYPAMPADLQKVFGYDIHFAGQLPADQVEQLEQQRLAAAAAGK
ncbi:MAG: hypothetical protein WDO13_11105 [Verrucomicrobiota bacterium]